MNTQASRSTPRKPGGPLRRRWQAWWLARHGAADALTLTQRTVYVLPTRSGWMFVLTLCLLLVGAINYQLNLGYVLTFLLAGAGAAGMLLGHGTLRGLQLALAPPQPVFAGAAVALDIRLSNTRRQPRHAIGVALHRTRQWTWVEVPAQATAQAPVAFVAHRRGLHRVPMLIAETRFPMGLFRVWTLWQPEARVLVYPAPEPHAPPLPRGRPRQGGGWQAHGQASSDFEGVRAYRRGDPSKLIVWKKWAQSGTLVSRDTSHMHGRQLWLDWHHTGLAQPAARLSRLTAWVLAADTAGLEYGLRLPGGDIAPARGHPHRLACLHALATCELPP